MPHRSLSPWTCMMPFGNDIECPTINKNNYIGMQPKALTDTVAKNSSNFTKTNICGKKSVRFADATALCQEQETLSLADYTQEEKNSVWYSKSFYCANKQSIVSTVQKMSADGRVKEKEHQPECVDDQDDLRPDNKNVNNNDSGYYCMRGLEHRTSEGAHHHKMNKAEAIFTVMDEQERQVLLGIHDPILLSELYIECSAHCRQAAMDMGLSDEKEVESFKMACFE